MTVNFLLRSLRRLSRLQTATLPPTFTLKPSYHVIPTRSFAFSSAEEAAAERRRRKRRLRIEPPLHALQRDPNSPRPKRDPNQPDTTSALVGPRLSLHNRVQSLIRAGDLDNASVVARQSVFSTTRPTVFTCNAIIGSMYRAKRYSDAIALFTYFFKQCNIVPNVVSYNFLIVSYCESGEVDKGLEVYQHIKENAPFSPSAVTFRHLTKGLVDAGRIDEAVNLLWKMVGDGHGADSHVFNNVILGFLNLGNLEKANEFFDELKSRCMVYDGIVNATFMEWFFSQGRVREAMESYKSLLDKEFKMVPATCNVLLEVLLKWGRKVEAEALFDSMLDRHTPPVVQAVNSDTFNLMVNECFKEGRELEAYSVFKKAGKAPKSKPFAMDTAGFNNMIMRYCEKDMVDDAEKMYVELCGKSLSPDVNTYRTLIDAYLKLGRIDEAMEKYTKMVEAGLRVIPTYANKWFSELIENGKIVECVPILTKMGEKDPKPDATTYDIVIRALCAVSNYDTSLSLLQQMVSYGVGVTPVLKEHVLDVFDKLSALSQLRNIFGVGKRDVESIAIEVTSKVYRKRLAESVTGGALEAAESKAAFLQNLCEELHFDPEKAIEIHEAIYRQNLQQYVNDGELSDDEVKSLEKLQVMLCIPKQTIEKIHKDICGALFEKVVKEAIAAGVDGYDDDVKQAVRKAAYGLRLTRGVAMSIAGKAVRKIFISYIQRSRASGSRTEAARELKKMIAFNNLVVTELVSDIKGESSETPTEDAVIDVEAKPVDEVDDEEWESLQTLRKVKLARMTTGKPGQTEITLKGDLPDRDRTDLYKTYLLYCLTGEVTRVPFGAQITTKKDDSEYVFLKQLGGILGLTDKEIVEVHRSLAEQAFTQQAEVILADGQLTKARVSQLNELQRQVGLPSEYAQKIIKNITSTKMAAALETAVGQGRLSIREIRELKGSGIELDVMVSLSLRQNLFKKTVDDIFSSGTGEFDEVEVYEKIPEDLGIDANKARDVVHELARTRLSNSLIQAVSLLRQRNTSGVVSSLNDLLACDKAVPASPLSWEVPEELADLFSIYIKNDPAPEKLSRLQYLLSIDDATAEALKEMKDRAVPTSETSEEEFVF